MRVKAERRGKEKRKDGGGCARGSNAWKREDGDGSGNEQMRDRSEQTK